MSGKFTILHIITTLNDGGAEAMLFRLCSNDRENNHIVISLMDDGKYGPMLREQGIVVHTLNLKRQQITLRAISQLYKLLRENKNCVVQTWMYHADLIGGLIAYASGIRAISWGIHNTILQTGISTKSTIIIAKTLAFLSRWLPAKIVAVSKRSIKVHVKLGYAHSKMHFIPNGYDISLFTPGYPSPPLLTDNNQRQNLNSPILGMIGRFDPYKDHRNLLQALSRLKHKKINFTCILVGNSVDQNNLELLQLIKTYDLDESILLLGQRNDIPAIMRYLDIHILSSSAEAFPNVVCEAMACGTPCVVTDVGDAADIVGETGWVVPPKDPLALANAIESAIDCITTPEWTERCHLSRERIVNNYTIENVVEQYSELWSNLIRRSPPESKVI